MNNTDIWVEITESGHKHGGKGWEFGKGFSLSDIYAFLEGVEGVDHVENLKLSANGEISEDYLALDMHYLPANGKHTLNIHLMEENS